MMLIEYIDGNIFIICVFIKLFSYILIFILNKITFSLFTIRSLSFVTLHARVPRVNSLL